MAVVLAIPTAGMNGFQTQYAGARVLCDAPKSVEYPGPTDQAMVELAQYIDENLGNRVVRAGFEAIASAEEDWRKGKVIRALARQSGLEDWETCAYAAAFDTRARFFGPDVYIQMTALNRDTIRIVGLYRAVDCAFGEQRQDPGLAARQGCELALQTLAAEDPDRVIPIRADANVPYENVVKLMDMARAAGLTNLAFDNPKNHPPEY